DSIVIMPNQPAPDPYPFTHLSGTDIRNIMVIDNPGGLIFLDHINHLYPIQLRHLILPGIEEIVEIFGIIQVLQWITVLKSDYYPAFRFFGIMTSRFVFKHFSNFDCL